MKKRVQRNFVPWAGNQERLAFAEEKLSFNPNELINEVLEKHLKTHIEVKAKKLREALSLPIP
jgi:hypothetical protein